MNDHIQKNPPSKGVDISIIKAPKRGGPSYARNLGIKQFLNDTDIFWMMDMDDVAYPDKLIRSLQAFSQNPHCHLVYSDYDILNTKTGVKTREYKESYSLHRLTKECIVATNSVMTSWVFKNIGIYDESLRVAEDYDLYLRIAEKAMLYHIPESLFQYTVHGGGATETVSKDVWNQCWQRVQEKRMARAKN